MAKLLLFILISLISLQQEVSKTEAKQLLKKLHYNNGRLTLLPCIENNSNVFFELTSREKNIRDTSYWGVNLRNYNVFRITHMPIGNYIISNDTIFQLCDNKIKFGYILKGSMLFRIPNVNLKRKFCLISRSQDSIRSIINRNLDVIKKNYLKSRAYLSNSEIVEVSDIHMLEGGNALVVFSLASINGLVQELFLYRSEYSSVSKIQFPKSIYRFYDIKNRKVVGQYENGGDYFIAEIDSSGLRRVRITKLNDIKGEYKSLKFISEERLIGLRREPSIIESLPIYFYNINESVK